MKKKLLFSSLGVAMTAIPVAAVISCGGKTDDGDKNKLLDPLSEDIKKFSDKKIPVDFTDAMVPKDDKNQTGPKWPAVSTFTKGQDITNWFESQGSIDLIVGVSSKVTVDEVYKADTNSIKLKVELKYGDKTKSKDVVFTGMNYTEQGLLALDNLVLKMHSQLNGDYTKNSKEKQFYPYGLNTSDLEKPSITEIYASLRSGWWFINAGNGIGIGPQTYGKYKADKYVSSLDALFGYNASATGPQNTLDSDKVKVDYDNSKITFTDYKDYEYYYDNTKVQPDSTLRVTMAYTLLESLSGENIKSYKIDLTSTPDGKDWISKFVEAIKTNDKFNAEKYDVVKNALVSILYENDGAQTLNNFDKTNIKALIKDDKAAAALGITGVTTKATWDSHIAGLANVEDAQKIIVDKWQLNFNAFTSALKGTIVVSNGTAVVTFAYGDFPKLSGQTNVTINLANVTDADIETNIKDVIQKIVKDVKVEGVDLAVADSPTNKVIETALKAIDYKIDEYNNIAYGDEKGILDNIFTKTPTSSTWSYDNTTKKLKLALKVFSNPTSEDIIFNLS